jgi:hypothetical protein
MYSGTPLFKWELPQPQAEITSKLEAGGIGLSPANQPQVGVVLLSRMRNNVCGGRVGLTGKKICISSSCRIMAHRGAPAPEFLSARNSTEGQLFIGAPNAANSQKEKVYAAPVMLAIGLGLQLQSMMTDKASVATWEGVFEASSVEVLTTKSPNPFCSLTPRGAWE